MRSNIRFVHYSISDFYFLILLFTNRLSITYIYIQVNSHTQTFQMILEKGFRRIWWCISAMETLLDVGKIIDSHKARWKDWVHGRYYNWHLWVPVNGITPINSLWRLQLKREAQLTGFHDYTRGRCANWLVTLTKHAISWVTK